MGLGGGLQGSPPSLGCVRMAETTRSHPLNASKRLQGGPGEKGWGALNLGETSGGSRERCGGTVGTWGWALTPLAPPKCSEVPPKRHVLEVHWERTGTGPLVPCSVTPQDPRSVGVTPWDPPPIPGTTHGGVSRSTKQDGRMDGQTDRWMEHDQEVRGERWRPVGLVIGMGPRGDALSPPQDREMDRRTDGPPTSTGPYPRVPPGGAQACTGRG